MLGYVLALAIAISVHDVNNAVVLDLVHQENECHSGGSVMRCNHHIPIQVPRNVTEVFITDLITTNEMFKRV